MDAVSVGLNELRLRLSSFIGEIKSCPVIYSMIEKLPVWKELEKLLQGSEANQ